LIKQRNQLTSICRTPPLTTQESQNIKNP
jgi:hypothetical protein